VVVEGVDRLRDGAKVEIPGTGDHAAPAPAPAPGGDAAKSGRRRKNAQ
jgi:hypothetical protein